MGAKFDSPDTHSGRPTPSAPRSRIDRFEPRPDDILAWLPEAVFAIDTQGRVILWNRAMEALSGFKANAVLGRGEYVYALPFHGVQRPVLIDLALHWNRETADALAAVRKEGEILISETRNPACRADPCVLRHRVRPLYNSGGAVVGAVDIVCDITPWRQIEEQLQEREALLRRLSEQIAR